jgi:hypothetical protein
MSVCALIDLNSNVVVNMIIAEVTDMAPNGYQIVEVTKSLPSGIGWTWDGTKFTDPNTPVSE